MLGYLSADIICSEKQTIFRERSPRKIVSSEELLGISKIQLVVYYQICVLIGWATSGLFVIAH